MTWQNGRKMFQRRLLRIDCPHAGTSAALPTSTGLSAAANQKKFYHRGVVQNQNRASSSENGFHRAHRFALPAATAAKDSGPGIC
jgi:hypothetical protein